VYKKNTMVLASKFWSKSKPHTKDHQAVVNKE